MSEESAIHKKWRNRPAALMQLSFAEYAAQCDEAGRMDVSRAEKVGEGIDGGINTATPNPARVQHEPGQMNGLEKRYAAHLGLRKLTGEIADWRFEAIKLRLAPKTYYSPDFAVVTTSGRIELHETKGHWEDDARVKVKVAAAMFPWFDFVGVQMEKRNKTWQFEQFNP
jgi:hypothetical protein